MYVKYDIFNKFKWYSPFGRFTIKKYFQYFIFHIIFGVYISVPLYLLISPVVKSSDSLRHYEDRSVRINPLKCFSNYKKRTKYIYKHRCKIDIIYRVINCKHALYPFSIINYAYLLIGV